MKPFIYGVEIILSIVMILVIVLQTTKSEGLSGIIGGKMSSTISGKSQIDQLLERLTRWVAIAWFVVCLLMIYMYYH